jgi:hypothetical protein
VYGSDGSPFTLFGGRNGTLAALVVTAYMKSIPFIYNGVEVGNTVSMPFPFTSNVINWNKDLTITPEIKNILALRNFSDAIRRGLLTSYDNADVCAFIKTSGTDTVFVLSNLRNSVKTFTLPNGIAGATWFDAYTSTAENLGTTISLSAYQYRVFTNKATSLSVDDVTAKPNHFLLYPNPAVNGQVTIEIETSACGSTMKLYDLSGREVLRALLSSSSTTFDLSSLKRGVYIVVLNNTSGIYSQKLMIE